MKFLGNIVNPKYCVVLNSPEVDDLSNPLSGPKGLILNQAIDITQCAIAFLCPEPLIADVITGEGTRKPVESEIEKHLPELIASITSLDCSVVIPLGATLLKCFLGPDCILTKEVGKKHQRTLNNKKLTIVPNFDPGMVYRRPEVLPEFSAIFTNIDKVEKGAQWAILDYNDAIKELKRALKLYAAGKIDHIIFDTETTSLEPHDGKLIMYSWSHDADERGFAVPLVSNNSIPTKDAFKDYSLFEDTAIGTLSNNNCDLSNPFSIPKVNITISNSELNNINMLVKQVLETIPIVGHNLKFDIKYTHYHGIADLRKVHIQNDTYIMGFQVFGKGFTGWLSLKGMAQRYCGAPEWDAIVGNYLGRFRELKDRHYGNIPTGMLGYYACLDAYWNKELYKYMKRVLKPEMKEVTRLVTDMIRPFAEAEVKGVMIDMGVKAELEKSYSLLADSTYKSIMELPKISVFRQFEYNKLYKAKQAVLKKGVPNPDKIWEMVLKLKNPAKIKEIMYGEKWYNLPVLEDHMTKGGAKGIPQPETGKDVRKKFIDEFLNDATIDSLRPELPEKEITNLLEARDFLELMNQNSRMNKLLNTYLGENLMAGCEGTLLKPNFHLCGTVSGRLSSGLHTVDSWSDIKRLYVSRWKGKGGVILAPDFSQLELRIAACVSGDPALIQTYVDDIDVHNVAASKMFKIPLEQVTKPQRSQGKILNFSILYGKTEHGLSIDLGVSKDAAKEMIEGFFAGFPLLKTHFDKATKWITTEGCIHTAWGRRVPIADWDSKNKGKLQAAIRSGLNATIQSAASDCVLWTIRETNKELVDANLKSFMIASVHDSIEFDTYPGDFFKVLSTVRNKAEVEMAQTLDWIKCPIRLGFEMGVQWGSAVEFEIKELTDTYFKGHGKGLRRDVQALVDELKHAYTVNLTVLKEIPKEYKPGDIAYVIRDELDWEIEIEISAK